MQHCLGHCLECRVNTFAFQGCSLRRREVSERVRGREKRFLSRHAIVAFLLLYNATPYSTLACMLQADHAIAITVGVDWEQSQ